MIREELEKIIPILRDDWKYWTGKTSQSIYEDIDSDPSKEFEAIDKFMKWVFSHIEELPKEIKESQPFQTLESLIESNDTWDYWLGDCEWDETSDFAIEDDGICDFIKWLIGYLQIS